LHHDYIKGLVERTRLVWEIENMTYELRLFSSDQEQDYRKLFDSQGTQVDPETRARRDWWCFQNPNGGAFAVILSGERVVSTCYLSGKRITQGENIEFCYEIGETATDSDHQRKGLFSKLVNAMTTHAATTGAKNVYGTPNPQSAPGYKKLGFKNVPVAKHAMILLPNLGYWIIRRGKQPRASTASGKHEIDAAGYIKQTQSFSRLNEATTSYLQWRFMNSPRQYKYFRQQFSSGTFHCAARPGILGKLPVVVVAEHYWQGTKTPIGQLAPLLRKTLRGGYSNLDYAGIYVLAETPEQFRKTTQIRNRTLFHRDFPVCVQNDENGSAQDFVQASFQLSDCDIG
jgi:GNAT superfamily N-acetyltransferase